MAMKKRRFKGGEIPTASMADIAFLLLIFFLVTTTIDTDKGLGIILPPKGDTIEIKKKNILNCLINSSGNVLLGGEPVKIQDINRVVKEKLRVNNKLIISVKTHGKSRYRDYVKVIDQLKMANATRISIAESEL
ncbi:MAG: biopolymer transporter ExbD [Candidatus Marinimicrobia bacterium]|nr:biopolymer transporter ExbD [Candidatus Neomarinimicrobiota bacterium]MBL7060175.1 biopolymer transporter ExbD [Candidatus Neomarinimicrobiota bacterium]